MILLPPKRAAVKCGVSLTTFNLWRRDLTLALPPPRIIRGRKLWVDADLDAWMSALPTEPTEG